MARKGTRITLWLPDEMMEYIEQNRGWRSTSDYLRTMIDGNMGKKPAKPVAAVKAPEPKPESTSIDLIRRAYDALYSEEGAWAKYSARYDSLTDALNEVLKNAFFNRKLEEMRAKKNPA